jgi:hypothetical protein
MRKATEKILKVKRDDDNRLTRPRWDPVQPRKF